MFKEKILIKNINTETDRGKKKILAAKNTFGANLKSPRLYSSMHNMPPRPIMANVGDKHSVCVEGNTSEMPSDS